MKRALFQLLNLLLFQSQIFNVVFAENLELIWVGPSISNVDVYFGMIKWILGVLAFISIPILLVRWSILLYRLINKESSLPMELTLNWTASEGENLMLQNTYVYKDSFVDVVKLWWRAIRLPWNRRISVWEFHVGYSILWVLMGLFYVILFEIIKAIDPNSMITAFVFSTFFAIINFIFTTWLLLKRMNDISKPWRPLFLLYIILISLFAFYQFWWVDLNPFLLITFTIIISIVFLILYLDIVFKRSDSVSNKSWGNPLLHQSNTNIWYRIVYFLVILLSSIIGFFEPWDRTPTVINNVEIGEATQIEDSAQDPETVESTNETLDEYTQSLRRKSLLRDRSYDLWLLLKSGIRIYNNDSIADKGSNLAFTMWIEDNNEFEKLMRHIDTINEFYVIGYESEKNLGIDYDLFFFLETSRGKWYPLIVTYLRQWNKVTKIKTTQNEVNLKSILQKTFDEFEMIPEDEIIRKTLKK